MRTIEFPKLLDVRDGSTPSAISPIPSSRELHDRARVNVVAGRAHTSDERLVQFQRVNGIALQNSSVT